MVTPSDRLLDRLRAQGVDIPEGSRIERTRAGRDALSKGSWSWFVLSPVMLGDIGSHYPVTVLLRYAELDVSANRYGQVEVYPKEPPRAAPSPGRSGQSGPGTA